LLINGPGLLEKKKRGGKYIEDHRVGTKERWSKIGQTSPQKFGGLGKDPGENGEWRDSEPFEIHQKEGDEGG